MAKTYLEGLQEAYAAASRRPTAHAFSVAAEIAELVAAEQRRLFAEGQENARRRAALAPRYEGGDKTNA